MKLLDDIIVCLRSQRLPCDSEMELQYGIGVALDRAGIEYSREHRLDRKNRVDFFANGIAIEVKIQGSAKNIYDQCWRYAEFPTVEAVVLVTSKTVTLPDTLNGKPCRVVRTGEAWL